MSPHTDPAAPLRWRTRLRLGGRTLALAAVVSTTALSGVAVSATGGASPESERTETQQRKASSSATLRMGSTGAAVKKLQRRLRVRATGYYGKLTKRAVIRFQRRRGLKADGIAGPATLRALGLRVRSTRRRGSTRLPAILKRIAQCESGGNPRAISPDGRYRGKYQFDRPTWQAYGGKGDPARAPERVQDRIALRLYRARGTAPWPNCA